MTVHVAAHSTAVAVRPMLLAAGATAATVPYLVLHGDAGEHPLLDALAALACLAGAAVLGLLLPTGRDRDRDRAAYAAIAVAGTLVAGAVALSGIAGAEYLAVVGFGAGIGLGLRGATRLLHRRG